MVTINHSALIAAEPQAVWHLLRQFGAIDNWHPQIESSVIEGGKFSGDGGSVRTLSLVDNRVVHHRLVSIDNDLMTMTYGLSDSGIPLEEFSATVRVTATDVEGQSDVEWIARFEVSDANEGARYESLIGEFILNALDGLAEHLGVAIELDRC